MHCDICFEHKIICKRILDGYICSNCAKKLPKAHNRLNVQDAREFINYIPPDDYQIFNPSAKIGALYIDEAHGWISIGENKTGETHSKYVYDMVDITCFHLEYNITDLHPGYVVGNYRAIIKLSNPKVTIIKKVALNVCSENYTYTDSGRIIYNPPEEMTIFQEKFSKAYTQAIDRYKKEMLDRYMKWKSDITEESLHESDENTLLKNAKEIYRLHSIYTKSDIKRRRNQLMKIFHQDVGENDVRLAQTINQYYSVLEQNIKEL